MPLGKQVFEVSHRGFTCRAYYREDASDQSADVAVELDGKPYKTFTYPAYRIWNIAAHFSDMIDNEIMEIEKASSDHNREGRMKA